MVHRQIYYRDEKCVLLLGTYIKERMPRYFELETKHFFDEVYLFRFGGYRGSEEEIIRQVGEELARSIPYRAQDFERILIAGIHTYLQVYLLSEGISFEMFEDGSGALSRPWVLAQIHQKSAPGRYALIEKYGLYDHTSPLITKKYCDMAAQEPGFLDPRAEDFQVMEEFHRLPGRQQEEIRCIFQVPRLSGREDEVLLLTQQFASLGQLSFDGQIDIYRHLFGYYLEGRQVVIKPHPDDILYYPLLFPEARLIEGTFPSELLPLAFERMPGTVCTVSSTGVNQIRRFFGGQLVFGPEYEESYRFDPLCYMALCLAVHLGVEGVLTEGVSLAQVRNMPDVWERPGRIWSSGNTRRGRRYQAFSSCGETAGQEGGKGRGRAGERDCTLAQRERKVQDVHCGAQGAVLTDAPPCGPGGRKRAHDVFLFGEERGEQDGGGVQTGEISFLSGYDLSMEELTDEEMRIRMLEGILAATEKRLLEYIETEKELRQEIKRLKETEGKRGWS